MRAHDARRLTGPNLELGLPGAGAVVELAFDPAEDALALAAAVVAALRGVIGAPTQRVAVRAWAGGAAVATPGAIDTLYALVDALEWAAEHVAGAAELTPAAAAARYHDAARAQGSPALLALEAAARARGAPFLWDDDLVSVGHGHRRQVWPASALPAVEEVAWGGVGTVPIAIVTGTNGKTTTSRMLARILARAGHVVGASSTDGIAVGGALVERGDWTGPGAARRILRDPAVTAAVLETARGGMLRRGLGVLACDAAVVTNVAEDHFGDHGIASLAAMARVKALAWSVVRPGGRRVANAEDPTLVAEIARGPDAGHPDGGWVFFARDPAHPVVAQHRAAGGEAWVVADGAITRCLGAEARPVLPLAELPAAFGGAAQHNVANALAAAAVAAGLGVAEADIAAALAGFGLAPDDNPGRLEVYERGGVRVLLDFGHNPHGVRAVLGPIAAMMAAHPGGRVAICVGQAGDRSDADLAALVHEACRARPARAFVRPLPGYERGRAPGETERVLRAAFLAEGLAADDVVDVVDEVDALERGFGWARPGDLLVHLVHVQRAACRRWLAERAG